MTAIKYGLLALCLSATSLLKAQTSRKITLDIRAIDDRFGRSMIVAPCFYYTNPVESCQTFGTGNAPLLKSAVRLPEHMGAMKDTAYGYIFYGAAENAFSPGYMLFLTGNNRRLELPHPIWLDRNNNLDFSDDGPPDTLVYYQRHVDLFIPGTRPGQGEYVVRLSRFPVDSFFTFKNMVNTFYGAARGTKRFADANHSFREQRLNILASDVYFSSPNGTTDSFRIGLKDVNCNGFYNEAGIDELLIGRFGETFVSEQARMIESGDDMEIEWELRRYQVSNIASNGKSIQLEQLPNSAYEQSLKPGKKMPRFRYLSPGAKQRKQSVRALKGKPLYVFIWNSNKAQFTQDSAALNQLIREYENDIRVLCLNYGDSPKWIAKFNQYYNTKWLMGFSSSDINDKLKIQYIPWGIFVDRKQRVVLPLVHPPAMLDYMRNIRK